MSKLAPLPTAPDALRALIDRLERRALIGVGAGGDPQAAWIRNRLEQARALLVEIEARP